MTESILGELYSASFRGVPFLVKSGSTTGGRKTVTHEYPNADRRFVEDLGELKETFSVEGLIHGDNYFSKRDALILALKTGGSGELIHPWYGTSTVSAKPYSVVENTTRLGIANFSMTFERSDESIFPAQSSNNKSLIDIEKSNTVSSIQTGIEDIFNVDRQNPLNFSDAKSVIGSIADKMQINSDTQFKVVSEISDFSSKIETFRDNANSNVFDPENLGSDFANLWNSFELIGSNAKNQFDLAKGLFNFGDDDPAIIPTTAQRIERKANRDLLNSSVKSTALAQAYNTVTDIDFETETEIKETQNVLDTQFDSIIDDNNLSDDTIQNLKNLRVEVSKFLEDESVNTFKISEITTQEIPTTILVYQYYGNVDKTQQIIDLNNTLNPTFISNSVDILTS